ncbi:hypothetical protein Tsubulata_010409 [Turnera subulata]|uniref:Uncharacterized protein n=1 Tax=Turnera subulata TaxID=218843 RepID=A0A9Q0JNS9_9ROSI|nr:hypothetical protein Tsubulata_010409 [Turnera subulata]
MRSNFTGAGSWSGGDDDDNKGLLWKLPEVRLKEFGKLGPAFGFGAGCGVGFGVGLIGGGAHNKIMVSGFDKCQVLVLDLGFLVCNSGLDWELGVGLGYGLGRGVARDESRTYSNVANLPTQRELGALATELVFSTQKLIEATSREIEKWRR